MAKSPRDESFEVTDSRSGAPVPDHIDAWRAYEAEATASDRAGTLRDKRTKPWFWLENDILLLLPHLGAAAFAVYAVLCRFADNDEQRCYPSVKALQRITGMGRDRVRKGLRTLEAFRLVVRVGQRERKSGQFRSMEYELHSVPAALLDAVMTGADLTPFLATDDAFSADGGFSAIGEFSAIGQSSDSGGSGNRKRLTQEKDSGRKPSLKKTQKASEQSAGTSAPQEGSQPTSHPTTNRIHHMNPPRAGQGKRPLPDDFTLTDAMRQWGTERFPTVDLDQTTEQWLDACRAKDYRYKDWVSAWKNGMRFAVEKSIAVPKPGGTRPDRTEDDWREQARASLRKDGLVYIRSADIDQRVRDLKALRR